MFEGSKPKHSMYAIYAYVGVVLGICGIEHGVSGKWTTRPRYSKTSFFTTIISPVKHCVDVWLRSLLQLQQSGFQLLNLHPASEASM